MPTLSSRLVAEFLGVFTLVFIGSAAIAMSGLDGSGMGLVGVALAHGLAIAVMVCTVGHVSGAHFNPAVTFGLWTARKISTADAAAYWVAQLFAALVATWALMAALPSDLISDIAAVSVPVLHESVDVWQGVFIEALLTFLLVWTVIAVAVDQKGAGIVAGLPIGLIIVIDVLAGGPLTGAAMNPARAFGPMLATGEFGDWWVWWAGPLAGGVVAALAYTRLIQSKV